MSELYKINKSTLEELADTVRTATGQTGPISFDQIEAVAKESIIISNGGTSGGEIGTCTITIDHMDTPGYQIIATQIVDGVETIYLAGADYNASWSSCVHPIILSNIKCGSAIVFEQYDDYLPLKDRIVELSSGVSLVKMYKSSLGQRDVGFTSTWVFKAPPEGGVDCTITIM